MLEIKDEELKKNIFSFLREKSEILVPPIDDLKSVHVKDCDDEIGFIGEHYILNFNAFHKKTCYVNVSKFKEWLGVKKSIIWK